MAQSGNMQSVDALKTQHQPHVRKGDSFKTQVQQRPEEANSDASMHVMAMDFDKNLPLPLTGISQEDYKQQLWLHNPGMHDCGTSAVRMFLYAEHFAAKGANELISCFEYYLSQILESVKGVHIFADNIFSQN